MRTEKRKESQKRYKATSKGKRAQSEAYKRWYERKKFFTLLEAYHDHGEHVEEGGVTMEQFYWLERTAPKYGLKVGW